MLLPVPILAFFSFCATWIWLPSGGLAELDKRAVQIVKPENGKFGINVEALQQILMDPRVATKKVSSQMEWRLKWDM
jgi:hypothetical protein